MYIHLGKFLSFFVTHRSLCWRLKAIATLRIICDVEGMVSLRPVRVVASLHDEGVGLSPHHIDFRDEEAIDVPSNAPAHVTCNHDGEHGDLMMLRVKGIVKQVQW